MTLICKSAAPEESFCSPPITFKILDPMQGFLSCFMTLFVTFLSQAIILHTVSPDSRAHQHLSWKRSRLKTHSLAVTFQTSSLSEETKVMPRKDVRGVCVRSKKSLQFSGKRANCNYIS